MAKPAPRYFRLTELGKRLFGFEKAVDGRRAHWMKVPLDWFNNPTVLSLPDSQKLPLLGVGLLCIRRDNSVLLDVVAVRRALNLRVNPDLALFMDQGLIELDVTSSQGHSVRGEEREEKRERRENPPPTPSEPKPDSGADAPPPSGGVVKPKPETTKALAKRATWLTRPGELWRARWGEESEPPFGEMASAFVKPLKAFEARGEVDELWARWERFLAAAERAEWARPARFVQGLGQWAGPGPPSRASPRTVAERSREVYGLGGESAVRDHVSQGDAQPTRGLQPGAERRRSGPVPGGGEGSE